MTTALLLDILDKHLKEAQTIYIAGWSSPVARRAHNPKVVGSNPASATIKPAQLTAVRVFFCLDKRRNGVALLFSYNAKKISRQNFRFCKK